MPRTALITGAARGIGLATSKLFAESGWSVVAVDRQATATRQRSIRRVTADVSDPTACARMFDELASREGRLDCLVNNAAIQIAKPLAQTSVEEWDAMMASNVRSVFLTVRSACALLRQTRGSIVNVSSVHAVATSANIAAYAATKGAVLALTRALAIELAPDKIRVNAVLPGAVDTPMLRSGLSRGHPAGGGEERLLEKLRQRHILGRIGEPDDIAQAILFLADDSRAGFITGQALIADGGATARLSTE